MSSEKTTSSAPMKWTELHDQLLVREILLVQPWTSKKASPERGEAWLKIATSLNSLQSPVFRVTQRSVRDRFTLLEKKYKKKVREETLASGICCEENEVDLGMDEIVSLFYEADMEHEKNAAEKKKKLEEDANQAAEMRQQSLESFGETRKRSESAAADPTDHTSTKRRRSSGSDMVTYLSEKSEREAELKKKELEIMKLQTVKDNELRENDMKLRKEAMEAAQNQNNSMMNQLVELQRIQQQQFMQLMRQQQEQSSCMMALLNKLTSQK
ncbi:uncharacterized protein LOC114530820 [Dendronephthya gigantea]|uniref:uncharacterized protein LOC114530820 n=1 Tax=Dendronephthya gigantea TaxID=151771 RepID=UPI00106A9FEB|nr:uncharacterized protein LOC114530820 [Dendronephthya gigantea]